MKVSLIWHIVGKDLRHTWMWIVAVFLSFAGWGVTNSMMMLSPLETSQLWSNALAVFSTLLPISVVLFLSMLLHGEALPGERQYWLARPVNWKDLLAAKAALGFAVIFPALALTLFGILQSQGFEIHSYLPQLLWKITLLLSSSLPLAVLISVTKNLQQMALWCVGFLLFAQLLFALAHSKAGTSSEVLWIGDIGCTLLSLILAAVIVVWQFATRRTTAARIGLVAIFLLYFGGESLFPNRFLFAAQERFAPVIVEDTKARIELGENRKRTWDNPSSDPWVSRDVFLPLRLSGMGTSESATFDAWEAMEVISGGERMKLPHPSPWLTGVRDSYWLRLPVENGFLQRHSSDLTDIKVTGQMTLYGNKKNYLMTASTGRLEIPGVCRCQLVGSLISCTAPFQIRQRLVIYLKDSAGVKQEQVIWLHAGERRPFSMNFSPSPIEYANSDIPSGFKLEPNDQLEFEVSEAQSFVERSFEFHGIRLADYAR